MVGSRIFLFIATIAVLMVLLFVIPLYLRKTIGQITMRKRLYTVVTGAESNELYSAGLDYDDT